MTQAGNDEPLRPSWEADAAVAEVNVLVPDLADGPPKGSCLPLLPPTNRAARKAGIRLLHHQATSASPPVAMHLPPNAIYLEVGESTVLPVPGFKDPSSCEDNGANPGIFDTKSRSIDWIQQQPGGDAIATPPARLDGAAFRVCATNNAGQYTSRLLVVGPAAASAVNRVLQHKPDPAHLDPERPSGARFAPPIVAAVVHHDVDRDGRNDAVGFLVYPPVDAKDGREYFALVIATADGAPTRSSPSQFANAGLWFVSYLSIPPADNQPPLLMAHMFCCGGLAEDLLALEPGQLRRIQRGSRPAAAVTDERGRPKMDTLCLVRSPNNIGTLHIGSRPWRRGEGLEDLHF